jgi:hypothetical protein
VWSDGKRVNMIKLIVTDVDDTLVPESYTDLNPEYLDVIRECKKKGILFVAASGRQKKSIRKTFEPLQDEICYLADNGSDVDAGEFVTSIKFEEGDYEKLAKDIQELGPEYGIMASKPNITYVSKDRKDLYELLIHTYGCNAEMVEDVTKLDDICKVSMHHEGGVPKEVVQKMQEKWSNTMDVCIAGQVYLDFTKKGCSKGSGLQILQEHYGILPEETASFGNADNDIPMILQAKYGYAVGNASTALKEAAREVIGSMEEDAVLEKIKEILASLEG